MIRLLKLVTGEEVIADVTTDVANNDKLILKNPLQIGHTPQGVGMAPFCMFMKGNSLTIDVRGTVFITEVDSEIENAYKAQFGGIVTPGGSGLALA